MPVPFNQVAANTRVPLFYAEMDNSKANSGSQSFNILLIGQKLATGTAASGEAIPVASGAQADALFGAGSMLASMVYDARANDPNNGLYCIALDDNASGVAAQGTITVAGSPTATGVINVYIAGRRVQTLATAGETATVIAARMVTNINADTTMPVTATNAAGVVTWTCKWKGATGNDINQRLNYRGALGGEYLPAGVTVTFAKTTVGAADPLLGPAVIAMGDDEYDFICCPYNDTTSLNLLGAELNDTTGRWSPQRQIYGHVYSAYRGALSAQLTYGGSSNDQHCTVYGYEVDVPTPVWEVAAIYMCANSKPISIDPSRPTHTIELIGMLPAPKKARFLWVERQQMLFKGIATACYSGGSMRIERAVTRYQKNAWGVADDSYLDSETMHQSANVIRRLRAVVTSQFGRHKLGNDGQSFGEGQAIVTPSMAKGAIFAEYKKLEKEGQLENYELAKAATIVERNAQNPNRLDVLFAPDYVNQLRIFALLNQFRLQYAA